MTMENCTLVKKSLSPQMSEKDFENGYWYAVDLKRFAQAIGIPGASSLRKDELEQAIGGFLRTGKIKSPTKRALKSEGVRDSQEIT